MKNILIQITGILTCGWILFGCGKASVTEVERNIFVDHSSLNMFVGDQLQITASPTNETFTWTSEDASVATVSASGEVRAVNEGETNIIVRYDDVQRVIPVSVVIKIPATGIAVNKAKLELKPRESLIVTASLLPENSNDKAAILWQSTDPSIVKVTGGVVETLKEGYAKLIVTLEGNSEVRLEIPVDVSYTFPFNGPHILSSASPCIIQARDFDTGGQNYAFYDTERRVGSPNYRPELTSGNMPYVEAGTHISYIATGEWLQFTVEVQDGGPYLVDFEITASGNGGKLHIEVDGQDPWGLVDVPNNGSWSAFGWISERYPASPLPTITLAEGKHKIKFYVNVVTYNFRALRFTKQ
ncbi:MAG: Ig-like domain-containing protein [Tannerella sp.]|jgi:hypothetical protein|nr:Ig-like domain-containing protein [Tannerella sp.]